MQEAPFLSIVIPAYNEAVRLNATLPIALNYLRKQPYSTEILVVDDGSSDSTLAVIEKIAGQYNNVRVIRNKHCGKAYAVRTGVLSSAGKYILFSDADFAVPVEELEKLLPQLETGYDVVIASREGQNARRIGEPFYRHIMGRGFNLVVQSITLGGFKDTQCGFKAFRKDVAHNLFTRVLLYGDNVKPIKGSAVTGFDVEVLFLAVKLGYKVKEIPVKWVFGADTKVNPLTDTWRNFTDVIKVRWYDIRGYYNYLHPVLNGDTPNPNSN